MNRVTGCRDATNSIIERLANACLYVLRLIMIFFRVMFLYVPFTEYFANDFSVTAQKSLEIVQQLVFLSRKKGSAMQYWISDRNFLREGVLKFPRYFHEFIFSIKSG